MANTISDPVEGFLMLSDIDSDWSFLESFPGKNNGIAVDWIAFVYNADTDKLSLKQGGAAGPEIFPNQVLESPGPGQVKLSEGLSPGDAAGAVVTKNVPPGKIAGGIPATIIGERKLKDFNYRLGRMRLFQ